MCKAKELSEPWITVGLKRSIRVLKHKLYASWDEIKYKYYRNKICSLIRLSKSNYYHKYFECYMLEQSTLSVSLLNGLPQTALLMGSNKK